MTNSPIRPFGLRRETHTEASHNFRDTTGLRTARELEEEELVTIKFVESHSSRYNDMCVTDYWSTYEVSITEKGLALLDAYDKYWAELELE